MRLDQGDVIETSLRLDQGDVSEQACGVRVRLLAYLEGGGEGGSERPVRAVLEVTW